MTTRIAAALARVVNPRVGRDVIAAGMVRDLRVEDDGRVRLSFLLGAQDPASLVREVRQAVEGVEGVREVRVDVKDPSQAAPAAPGAMPGKPAPGQGKQLPVMQQPAPAAAPPRVAAPTPVAFPNLGKIIAISSGKGGVGKSTVATNIAVALARAGARVGLMDADIYGPNIPRMMGVNEPPPVRNERIIPLEAYGVKLMSIGFLVERDQPAIWRGPIIMKVITQFLRDVAWGELDYFLVDMPPGTGDAQLSLVQATMVHGAVIVTTPQEVAVGDSLRGAKMFQRVGVPVLGIVENMSYFACPHCGKPTPLFGSGGGARLASELGVPLLGEIPLYPRVMSGGDEGAPIVAAEPGSQAARALADTATRVAEAMGAPAGV
ncbi:MAG TPA: Mrp/NBP35 family ATP-binding protein [Gemmatimonadaceae bacterium]|nr:Mrp/NBP35 family ATP-binding protein [Gemmatimonadaceae bacterium]